MLVHRLLAVAIGTMKSYPDLLNKEKVQVSLYKHVREVSKRVVLKSIWSYMACVMGRVLILFVESV